MTNNDVLRRVRYCFDINDDGMIKIFGLAGLTVTRAEISAWLKKDDDLDYKSCNDKTLAIFLNGFIVKNRGPKEGDAPAPEKEMSNNLVLKKLKIAMNLQSEDILEILTLSDFRLSKHELSAFFRKPEHKHYRPCKDQILRNFLDGLRLRYRENLK